MSLFDKDKKALGRDDILKAVDLDLELVPVPEWGGDVWVRGMTGSERDAFEAGFAFPDRKPGEVGKLDMRDLRAKLCAKSICNEDGKLIFSESDVKALSQKSAAALQRVFKVAQRLSGIGDDDLEDMEESLKERPFDNSASD